jgi:hypothetical protein
MEVGVRFSFAHKIPGGTGSTEAGNPAVFICRWQPAVPNPRLTTRAAFFTAPTQARSGVLPCPPARLPGQVAGAITCLPG